MLVKTVQDAHNIPIPKLDYYDEGRGIQYGGHPCYTKKSRRVDSTYSYIRAGGSIHPPYKVY